MADQLETLRKLQALDGTLYRLRRERLEKPRALEQVREAVREQEDRLKDAEERMKHLQLAQKRQELELQTREANVKKLQGQLYQLKTNKEYTAMQQEISTLKADNSLLEEALLHGFDTIDQTVKERTAQQQQVMAAQERLRQETARIEREVAVIEEQMGQLDRQRQQLIPAVPLPTLSMYERILSLREGLALVPMVGESCGGCHRRLPPQVVNEVFLQASLVTCETCNRILYKGDA